MTQPDELATDDEIRDALEEARRNALANKAAAEILGTDKKPPSHHPFPDPPPDQILLKLKQVGLALESRLRDAKTMDRDAFDTEIRDRYAEVGIVVDVKWWYSAEPGVYIPEVEPIGLIDKPDDDPDRQVYDVTHDVLGTGDSGVIGG